MIRDEQQHLITRKCVEVNPEIVEVTPNQDAHGGFDPEWHPRTIRLSDVLLAACKGKQEEIEFVEDYDMLRIIQSWNLRQDDLSQQSDETIKFIADLLA